MERMTDNTLRSVGDYFAAFDERATGAGSGDVGARRVAGDGACGFCLAACAVAAGFFVSAASATAASPF